MIRLDDQFYVDEIFETLKMIQINLLDARPSAMFNGETDTTLDPKSRNPFLHLNRFKLQQYKLPWRTY
jgi:hypothetical protein